MSITRNLTPRTVSMTNSGLTISRLALVLTGVLSGGFIYYYVKDSVKPSVKRKERVWTALADSTAQTQEPQPETENTETWAVEESENLLNLLLSISEEQILSGFRNELMQIWSYIAR